MSRMSVIIAALAGLTLGGCMHPADDAPLAWSFQDEPGEGPKLAYGAPQSDNVVLMMTCEPGAATVNLSLLGGSPRQGVVLASNGERQAFGGEAVVSPGAGHMIEARAPVTAEPLARFARTGRLSLISRGRAAALDASPAERAGVSRFFEACRA